MSAPAFLTMSDTTSDDPAALPFIILLIVFLITSLSVKRGALLTLSA